MTTIRPEVTTDEALAGFLQKLTQMEPEGRRQILPTLFGVLAGYDAGRKAQFYSEIAR